MKQNWQLGENIGHSVMSTWVYYPHAQGNLRSPLSGCLETVDGHIQAWATMVCGSSSWPLAAEDERELHHNQTLTLSSFPKGACGSPRNAGNRPGDVILTSPDLCRATALGYIW